MLLRHEEVGGLDGRPESLISRVLNNLRIDQQRLPRGRVFNGILLALLAVLLVGVLTFDRSEWPSLIGD
jgi:hypothetical protein